MWLGIALCSALLLGVYDVCKKHALNGNAVLPILFLATVFGSIPFVLLIGLNAISLPTAASLGIALAPFPLAVHLKIAFKAVLVGASWGFTFFALKHLPITLVSPIRSTAPVWTLLGAFYWFGEELTLLQYCGVAIACSAYVVLARAGTQEGISFLRSRWIWSAVMGMLLGACSALYDKYLLLRLPPLAMQCWFYMYLVLAFGLVLIFGWFPYRSRLTPFTWRRSIPLVGLLLAIADLAYFHAVAHPDAMIGVISVIRRSGVVVAFLLGGQLFREKNLKSKAVAVLAIVFAVALIALAKRGH